MSSPHELPGIGKAKGRQSDTVVQFLGIKYASLSSLLALPVIKEYSGKDVLDFSQYGPTPVIPPSAFEIETYFIQQQLEGYHLPPTSALDGLNLNITVPTIALKNAKTGNKLPVLVYVHGGGFEVGSSSYPHYDQKRLVDAAISKGNPILAVNFNYRLGSAGFMTSQELRTAGFLANNGLRDQRAAFQWLRRYISAFGGDPNNITAIGQSAGSASLTFHLQGDEPLFRQAILLSGTGLMMGTTGFELADLAYGSTMAALGLYDDRCRITSFQKLSPNELIEKKPPMSFYGAVVDGDIIPQDGSFADYRQDSKQFFPGHKWCERLFIVDSQLDGSIIIQSAFAGREKSIARKLWKSISVSLRRNPGLEDLLNFYGIQPELDDNAGQLAAARFLTDILFYAPSITLATGWPGPSYLAHFQEPNPWPGAFQGETNHMLDVAYLFQNYNDAKYLNQKQIAVSEAFADDIITFTVSKSDPFRQFEDDQVVRVYGPSTGGLTKAVVHEKDIEDGRSPKFFELAEKVGGLDVLLTAARNFIVFG